MSPRTAPPIVVAALLGCVSLLAPVESTRAAAEPSADYTVFVEHRITDPGMNGALAFTVLAPEGWTRQGEMMRLPPAVFNAPPALDIKFIAPDGRQARFLPALNFEFGPPQQDHQFEPFGPTANGNLFYPLPESPGAWVADMVERFPDATVREFRVIEEAPIEPATERLREQNAVMFQMVQQINAQNMQVAQQGMQMGMAMHYESHFDTQATRVETEYTQDGQRYRETIVIAWSYWVNLMNGQVQGGNWSISEMRAARSPAERADHLDDPQIMAVFQSLRPDPVWMAEMQRHAQRMTQIRAQGQADRDTQWRQHNAKMQQIREETNAIINDGWHDRQALQDRGHERFRDVIADETRYVTPAGSEVTLPNFYDHAYTDGNGRYILSNDPNFTPVNNPNLIGDWQAMQEKP